MALRRILRLGSQHSGCILFIYTKVHYIPEYVREVVAGQGCSADLKRLGVYADKARHNAVKPCVALMVRSCTQSCRFKWEGAAPIPKIGQYYITSRAYWPWAGQ